MTRRSLPPFTFDGALAVVTGAASGMGREMARLLAGRGCDLVLVDVDGQGLHRIEQNLQKEHPGRTVTVEVVDLADATAVDALAGRLVDRPVRLLINNAGMAMGGTFTQMSVDQFELVMAVNFRAPVRLTHALLPTLAADPGGHIVNVSSVFGLLGPPGQSAYAASKFALRGWSEALRGELRPRAVGVTTVHPGGVRTNIAANAKVAAGLDPEAARRGMAGFARSLRYPPERAAAEILRAVERRRTRLLIGTDGRLIDLLTRLLPVGHQSVVDAVAERALR